MVAVNLRPYSICRIWIRIWIWFSESVHLVCKPESGFTNPVFGMDSLAEQQYHKRKQITIMSLPTIPTNPDHSICQWIQIRIHYENEYRFGQIEYGLCVLVLIAVSCFCFLVRQPTAGAVLPAVHDRTEGVLDCWRSCLERSSIWHYVWSVAGCLWTALEDRTFLPLLQCCRTVPYSYSGPWNGLSI